MFKRKLPSDDYPPLAALPVKRMIINNGKQKIAFHLSGRLDDHRPPLVCLADYLRNMADFAGFLDRLRIVFDADWPVLLIDLPGRGRSVDRKNARAYSTLNDARDVEETIAMLGIQRAILLGQGHGGRMIMNLGSSSPNLIAGSILIDAAPLLHAPGMVRLRDNISTLLRIKNPRHFLTAARKIYEATHTNASQEQIELIIERFFSREKSRKYRPLFDTALLKRLKHIEITDIFEPQWPLFHTLKNAPMMLLRTQSSDQLERTTFEYMGQSRSDAIQLVIAGEGCPALLSNDDEVGAIGDFIKHVAKFMECGAIISG